MKIQFYLLVVLCASCSINSHYMQEARDMTSTFIGAIEMKNVEKMKSLMTDGCVFIDAHDNKVFGRDENIKAWEHYFQVFPDYKIEAHTWMDDGNRVITVGYASGTYLNQTDSASSFRIPVSILTSVDDGKISTWQVFADTKIPSDIIERNRLRDTTDLAVQAFGGVFFKAKDPKALAAWYDKQLGTTFSTASYTYFKWRDRENAQLVGGTTFGMFSENSDYYAPSTKPFMFNFRVNNLLALLEKLKSEGVLQIGEVDAYDYGKFAWIMDPEGNKIELWEPVDEVLEAYEESNKK